MVICREVNCGRVRRGSIRRRGGGARLQVLLRDSGRYGYHYRLYALMTKSSRAAAIESRNDACLFRSLYFSRRFFPLAGVRAVRVSVGPEIDGRLNDPVWAECVGPVRRLSYGRCRPRAANPTEKTELRVVYDEANLYIGILCRDREPARITANTLAHDDGGSASGGHGYYHHGGPSGAERRPGRRPPRSVPGQAHGLCLFRQRPRRPGRGPGLCRRVPA